MSGRAGAFIDRDGTIIRDANYVRDPNDVELLPGAAAAVARLNGAGVVVTVITNQSGIARGWLTLPEYEAVHARLDDLLAAEGARIDRTFMCPHFPDITGPCDCRKPGLKLYREAIAQFGIEAKDSLFVGDRWRDVAPGVALGGRTILLDVASTPPEDRTRGIAAGVPTANSLGEAVDQFLGVLPASSRGQ